MKPVSKADADTMRPEYHFDYSKAEWGKFAGKIDPEGTHLVAIQADVLEVFPDADAVNEALRQVIAIGKLVARPKPAKSRRSTKSVAKSA